MSERQSHPRRSVLERHAHGELDAAGSLDVDAHLVSCARCAALVESERRLDAWVVQVAPAPPPAGAVRQAFDRLWSDVDARPAAAGGGPRPVLRLAHWRQLTAAALVLALLGGSLRWWLGRGLEAGPPVRDEPVSVTDLAGGEETAGPDSDLADGTQPAGSSPGLVRVGTDLDAERLAAVRQQTLNSLLDAQARFPGDDQAFLAACEPRFEPLRRDGWPLSRLIRGHAFGPHAEGRAAALRYAALDRATAPILADGLDRRDVRQPVLALLDRVSLRPSSTPALERALVRLATKRPTGAASEASMAAARILSRDGDGDGLGRVIQRALAEASRPHATATVVDRFMSMVSLAPCSLAVPALLDLARVPRQGSRVQEAFDERLDQDRVAVCSALSAALADDRRLERGIEWIEDHRLTELAPALVQHLSGSPDDPRLQAALGELGAEAVAGPLFDLWRAERWRPAGPGLHRTLMAVLARSEASRLALGRAVPAGAVDDLVDLVGELPARQQGATLLACLAALPAAADRGGYRAFLLTSLARVGGQPDGQALLQWIAVGGPGNSALLPLAWATAGRLAGAEALAAWQRAGRNPAVLAAVAAADSAWPIHADSPPARLLRAVVRSLDRHPRSPPGSRKESS